MVRVLLHRGFPKNKRMVERAIRHTPQMMNHFEVGLIFIACR